MKMRSCEFCGAEIPGNASFCGICGRSAANVRPVAKGIGNYAPPGEGYPDSAMDGGKQVSPGRSTRRPYQFPPQPSQSQYPADVPTVASSPRRAAPTPVQQVPGVPPPSAIAPNSQIYPNAQPQPPLYIAGANPSMLKGPKPLRPRRR